MKELTTSTKTVTGTLTGLKTKIAQTIKYYSSIDNTNTAQNDFQGNSYTLNVVPKSGDNGFNCKITNKSSINVKDYVQDSLILHYDGILNNGTNHSSSITSWVDLSKSLDNGTLNNFSDNTNNGWLSNGLKYTDSNDYVLTDATKTDFSIFKSGTGFTYCSLFTTGTADVNNWQGVLTNMREWGNGGVNIQYGTAQGVGLGYGNYLTAKSSHDLNTRYSVCGSYDGERMKVYLNGIYINSNVYVLKAGVSTFKLGNFYHYGTSSSLPMNGIIHNFLFYNRALTDAEISQNYYVDNIRY